MRKPLLFLATILATPAIWSQGIIETTLLDHVSTVTQFKNGETKLALMDSIVLIGHKKGKSVFDIQAGFSGETKPEPNGIRGANIVVGGFLKINTLIQDNVSFPVQWEFLNSLEHGISYVYDFREKKDYVSYQVGLAFDLDPK